MLSSEDGAAYQRLLLEHIDRFRPCDIHAKMLLRHAVDALWEALRLGRHKPLVIERRDRRLRAYDAARRKQLEDRKRDLADERTESAEQQLQTAFPQTVTLMAAEGATEAISEILERPPNVLDHNRALENGLEVYGTMDVLQSAAYLRYRDGIKQLQLYQASCAISLPKTSEKIIELDYKEVEAVETSSQESQQSMSSDAPVDTPALVPPAGDAP